MNRATVRTVWLRSYSEDLHVNVTRGVGYKAVDRDRWAGPFRRAWNDAREDARRYNAASREAA